MSGRIEKRLQKYLKAVEVQLRDDSDGKLRRTLELAFYCGASGAIYEIIEAPECAQQMIEELATACARKRKEREVMERKIGRVYRN